MNVDYISKLIVLFCIGGYNVHGEYFTAKNKFMVQMILNFKSFTDGLSFLEILISQIEWL